jgi:hypothetical protein
MGEADPVGWPRIARSVYRLQIRSADAMVWRAAQALETSLLVEAMQLADRLARACRVPAPLHRDATRTWVVELTGEAGGIFYRAPVVRA